ncbi:MAG TPA: hypothetical protein VMY06_02630 [Sedimentisphaerales bacterium]|nr:hypothetical protein [Sedimentisphaerales bacterium]
MLEDEVIRFVERLTHEVVIERIEAELRKKPFTEIELMLGDFGCATTRHLANKMYWDYRNSLDEKKETG